MTTQLRENQVDAYRKKKAAQQKYRCPICKGSLAHGINALDHDHKNGQIRSVLCQSCNVSEGKVKAGMNFRTPLSNMARIDPVQWLRRLADYLEYHMANPSGVYHPTFDIAKGKQKPVKRKATVKPRRVTKTPTKIKRT